MSWDGTPATAIAGSVLTAAWLNTELRDRMLAVQAGEVALMKVTLEGAASDPGLSNAGEAVFAYNTTTGELRQSVDGGAFERLGGKKPIEDPLIVGGTLFGFRY